MGLSIDKVEERFWLKVAKTSNCWTWQGLKNQKGYGRFWMTRKRRTTAHRASWEIHFGAIPTGIIVLHKCDNPSCVRPNHLFLGTDLDNARDRERKGRGGQLRGEQANSAKLTTSQVLEIRWLAKQGESVIVIAKMFNVTSVNIGNIIRGKSWRHLLG